MTGSDDGSNKGRTLEEIRKQFDITRKRIREIEAKALRKLRHPTSPESDRDTDDSGTANHLVYPQKDEDEDSER